MLGHPAHFAMKLLRQPIIKPGARCLYRIWTRDLAGIKAMVQGCRFDLAWIDQKSRSA
jgi:hypothetical protein